MKILLLLAVSCLAVSGCKGEEVYATVNCKVMGDSSVECVIAETKGKSEVEVCWDFNVSCASGATLKAERSCGKVKDGGSTTVTSPADKVKVEGDCQGEISAAVTNMTLNGKTSDH